MSSKRIFVQETNAHNGHYIAGFDSIVYSQHHIGHIQGAARRIPAIMSESATDAMLWQVVNLKRDNGMFDSIAVLGAVDGQEASDWAMSQYGRMFDSVVVSTAETSAPGLMRHLDNPKLHTYTSHLKPKDLARMQDMTTSEAVMWDGLELLSHDGTLSLLLDMTKVDDDGLMLDSMTLDELKMLAMGDDGEVEGYDSLIVQNNQMQKLMDRLSNAMSKATSAGGITVSTVSQSEPFKKNKVTQVAAMFDLSDGQSVSIIFHNPDSTPAKLLPSDTLMSWKFLLNKRDISAAVQPNQGEDVQLPVLAGRIMKLVHANSARFKRTNAKKDENLKALADAEQVINDKNQQVMDLDAEIADLQAKIDAGVVVPKQTEQELEPQPTPAVDPAPADKAPEQTTAPATTQDDNLLPEEKDLKKAEARQEMMKAVNKAIRSTSGKEAQITAIMALPYGMTRDVAESLVKPDFVGRTGYPSYELTNHNALIKRLRAKAEFARKAADAENSGAANDVEVAGVQVEFDRSAERLRLVFDGKPEPDVIAMLKSNGFKWSPSNGAWQRQLTSNAIHGANRVLELHADMTGQPFTPITLNGTGDNNKPLDLTPLANAYRAGIDAMTQAVLIAKELMAGGVPDISMLDDHSKSMMRGMNGNEGAAFLLDFVMNEWNNGRYTSDARSALPEDAQSQFEEAHPDLIQGIIDAENAIVETKKELAAMSEPASNPDTEYLQSIVDGTADLSVAGDELERIGDDLPPELEALFEQAAEVYAQYAIALEV